MTTRVRLSPEARREQLLELGARLFATRRLDELSIDLLAEEAGISRGLLYHYFDTKQEFHRAVVGRAIDDLVEATVPVESTDALVRLRSSLEAYVDYVTDNFTGYTSLLQAANGGDDVLKSLYEGARQQLLDRMFDLSGPNAIETLGFVDTPAVRLVARGWLTFVEATVIEWVEDDHGLTREQVIASVTGALPGALDAIR